MSFPHQLAQFAFECCRKGQILLHRLKWVGKKEAWLSQIVV